MIRQYLAISATIFATTAAAAPKQQVPEPANNPPALNTQVTFESVSLDLPSAIKRDVDAILASRTVTGDAPSLLVYQPAQSDEVIADNQSGE